MQIAIRFWRCADEPQRLAMAALSTAWDTPVTFIPDAVMRALWTVLGHPDMETDAFIENFDIEVVNVEDKDEGVIPVWNVNREWMRQVSEAVLAGCFTLADPRCQAAAFPAARDPDCTYHNY